MANPPSLGTNLDAAAYWTTNFPYIDLMHQASGFIPQGTSWDTGVTLDLDSSGWVKSLPAGTWAGVYPILDNPAGADTAGDRYVVMYDGDGTFQGALGATISEASPGRFVLTSASDGTAWLPDHFNEPGRLRSRHPRRSRGSARLFRRGHRLEPTVPRKGRGLPYLPLHGHG